MNQIQPLLSVPDGIYWPALPESTAAGILALQFQFDQSQWWPRNELLEHQLAQLSELIRHAVRHVPFYGHLLSKYSGEGCGNVSLEEWQSIPLLSRDAVQESGSDLKSGYVPPEHGDVVELQTSGSTGKPIRVLQTSLTQFFLEALNLRDHRWHKRDLTAKMTVIRPEGDLEPGKYLERRGWGTSTEGLVSPAPFSAMNVRTPVHEQAAWLKKQNPVYFLSLPSNIKALAHYFRGMKWTLPALREIRSYGELLDSSVGEICREVWGVPVVDVYSSQEFGNIATQCPEEGRYHVQGENILVEIVDEDGRPCAPGEIGRIILTPLHNFAQPLIRYEIGDYAAWGQPCPCGRGLPVLEKIAGRKRNMLVLPDGRQHWPSFPAELWLPYPVIRQFQLIQTRPDSITVRLVAHAHLTIEEEGQLTRALCQRFGYPFHIAFEYPKEIERSKGGKFEDFISKVA